MAGDEISLVNVGAWPVPLPSLTTPTCRKGALPPLLLSHHSIGSAQFKLPTVAAEAVILPALIVIPPDNVSGTAASPPNAN